MSTLAGWGGGVRGLGSWSADKPAAAREGSLAEMQAVGSTAGSPMQGWVAQAGRFQVL